jgi:ATP-dependent DNA helicase RecG
MTPEWLTRAWGLLDGSLSPPKHELNELDWKVALSPDKKRTAEHLSAFSNQPGGGFLVFGVEPTGIPITLEEQLLQTIINTLANLGRAALEPPIILEHAMGEYQGARLLFVRIPESPVKPVHLRGVGMEHSFIRSGGTTRKAARQEIGNLMINSRTPRWEELRASILLDNSVLVEKIDIQLILAMLARPKIATESELLSAMEAEKFIIREPSGGGYITNLGAIAAAKSLNEFPEISRKAIRVIAYNGLNKAKTKEERPGSRGYALGFQNLMKNLMGMLPQNEIISEGLRKRVNVYPEIAIREITANALIRQDFSITGTGPLIEIFDDRIEISNPGGLLPGKSLDRLIGAHPESRNEILARSFRLYRICEERGSGLQKAGLQAELFGLAALRFESGPNDFKVTIFAPRSYAEMSARERLEACYQHAVLKCLSDGVLTSASLRERLKMPEKQRSMVSDLITEALKLNLIKSSDPENVSRKFSEYVPFWADNLQISK